MLEIQCLELELLDKVHSYLILWTLIIKCYICTESDIYIALLVIFKAQFNELLFILWSGIIKLHMYSWTLVRLLFVLQLITYYNVTKHNRKLVSLIHKENMFPLVSFDSFQNMTSYYCLSAFERNVHFYAYVIRQLCLHVENIAKI